MYLYLAEAELRPNKGNLAYNIWKELSSNLVIYQSEMTIYAVEPKRSFDFTNTPKIRVLKNIFASYNLLILC